MIKLNNHKALAALFFMVCFLIGCEGKDNQEKYLIKAKELYEEGNYAKAKVEVKNLLQINKSNSEGRYLLALLYEKDQNLAQVFANLSLAVESDPANIPARIKLGQIYFSGQAYDKALAEANAVLEVEPDNPDALFIKGSVLYKNNDIDGAVELAHKSLLAKSGHIGAISLLTEIYKDSNPELALSIISDGLDKSSKAAALQLLRISVFERQGELDKAESIYRDLISDNPDKLFYYYQLAKLYERSGQIDKAEGVLRDTIAVKPEEDELKLWLTQFLMNHKGPEVAADTLLEYSDRNPESTRLKFALGKIYTAVNRFDKAIPLYKSIIERYKNGADSLLAKNKLVEIFFSQNKNAEANQLLAEIFSEEPENTEGLITRAKLSIIAKDYKAAISDLRSALKNSPKNIDAHWLLVDTYMKDGSSELALDNLRQIIEIDPKNKKALYEAAVLVNKKGQADDAERLLSALINIDPVNTKAVSLLVPILLKSDKFTEAMDVINPFLKDEDVMAQGYYLKGRVYLAQKEYEEAIQDFKKSLEMEPKGREPLIFLVRGYLAAGEDSGAESYLKDYLKLYPDQINGIEVLASFYAYKKDINSSENFYLKSININPQRIEPYLGLGQLYTTSGNWKKVIDIYKKCIVFFPDNKDIQVRLAGAYINDSQYYSARSIYESWLKEEPESQVAANNLALLLINYFPGEVSLSQATELVTILRGSQQPEFIDTIGWVRYKNNDFDSAISTLQSVVSTNKVNSEIHYHLGMAYYKAGKIDLAKKYLGMAVSSENKNYFGYEEAKNVLTEISN